MSNTGYRYSTYTLSNNKVSVVMAGDLNYVYGHYNFTFVCTKLFLEIAVVSVSIFVGLNTASRRMASGSLVRQAGQSFGGQRACRGAPPLVVSEAPE